MGAGNTDKMSPEIVSPDFFGCNGVVHTVDNNAPFCLNVTYGLA